MIRQIVKRTYATTPKIDAHTVLFYKYVEDAVEKRAPHRMKHLYYAAKSKEEGKLLYGGAFDPIKNGAMLIFKGDCTEYARKFAEDDPYVKHGVVTSFEVRKWSTIAFEDAKSYKDE